jgi:hypothetical protein
MGRMSTVKLAKVMSNLDPERSTRLTELMAGVVRAKRAVPAPASIASTASNDVAATAAMKGGENK